MNASVLDHLSHSAHFGLDRDSELLRCAADRFRTGREHAFLDFRVLQDIDKFLIQQF